MRRPFVSFQPEILQYLFLLTVARKALHSLAAFLEGAAAAEQLHWQLHDSNYCLLPASLGLRLIRSEIIFLGR